MKLLKLFFFHFVSCILLFLSSCGLDEYYEINAPYIRNNDPGYETGYDNRFFSFVTNDSDSGVEAGAGFSFLGTAIYYKIYNNYSVMNSDISTISSLSTSTNYQNAATKVVEGLSYQQLAIENEDDYIPLIKKSSDNKNQSVWIRLMNYQYQPGDPNSNQAFRARVEIDDTFKGCPMRVGGDKSFDFGRTSDDEDRNVVPQEGDVDVRFSSSWSDEDETIWYVNLYAIAVGRDTTYTTYYSNVLHLGSVSINAAEIDN